MFDIGMKLINSNIMWVYQCVYPKAGTVWGWMWIGDQTWEYSGIVDIINGNLGLVLEWTYHTTRGLKHLEASKLMDAFKAGDVPVIGEPEDLGKLLFGMDFKKEVMNSLVYQKLAGDLIE